MGNAVLDIGLRNDLVIFVALLISVASSFACVFVLSPSTLISPAFKDGLINFDNMQLISCRYSVALTFVSMASIGLRELFSSKAKPVWVFVVVNLILVGAASVCKPKTEGSKLYCS